MENTSFNDEVKAAVKHWLSQQDSQLYQDGIIKQRKHW